MKQPPPRVSVGCRKIIHVDMDAFYASVEQRDDPALCGKPLVVGGNPEGRGVVAAASYEARRFGIHSAMPMRTALRLCPDLVRVSPDFGKYHQTSSRIHAIFREYTDLIEPMALDEAYLDVTSNKPGISFGSRVARMIKADIHRQLQLTASVGVAPNKTLAKIASDLDKPDGFVVVMPDQTREFLRDLPVSRIPGVGKVNQAKLEALRIHTVGELAESPVENLSQIFGRRGAQLWRLARGEDDDPVSPTHEPKQISQETTFPADIHDPGKMRQVLDELATELSHRLQRRNLKGRVVTLKARYPDFQTVTRSQSLVIYIDQSAPILKLALELLARTEAFGRGVRLLGIGIAGFDREKSKQLDLFRGDEES